MSDENNIENNEEQNVELKLNLPYKSWCKKFFLSFGYRFLVITIIIYCFINNIAIANDGKFEYLKGSYGSTAVVLNENEIFLPSYYKEVLNHETGLHDDIPVPAQIYNIKEKKFKSLNIFMNYPRYLYLAVKLDDNRVLIVGGEHKPKGRAVKRLYEAEIYDIQKNEFRYIGKTNYKLYNPVYSDYIKLNDGKIFIGNSIGNFEIFDPKTESFYKAGEETRYYQPDISDGKGKKEKIRNSKNIYNCKVAMALLNDGRVYIAGANFDGNPGNAEIYDPKTNTFTQVADQLYPRFCRSAVTLKDGRVLLTGGTNTYYSYSVNKKKFKPSDEGNAEIYDPKTNTYTPVGSLNVKRCYHSSILLSNGNILIVNGAKGPGGATDKETKKAEIFNPKTNNFKLISSSKFERWAFNIETITENKVLLNSSNGWEIYKY